MKSDPASSPPQSQQRKETLPSTTWKGILLRFCIILFCIWIFSGFYIWRNQNQLIFHPGRGDAKKTPKQLGQIEVFSFPSSLDSKQIHYAWIRRSIKAKSNTLIFIHGDYSCLQDEIKRVEKLSEAFDETLIFLELPGFGLQQAKITESSFKQWAIDCEIALKEDVIIDGVPILWSQDIAAWPAFQLAQALKAKQMILEEPVFDLLPIVRKRWGAWPMSWVLEERFDIRGMIKTFEGKIMIAYSPKDIWLDQDELSRTKLKEDVELVSLQGKPLSAWLSSKEEYFRKIKNWLPK